MDYKAIALSRYVTAREIDAGYVLVISSSQEVNEGFRDTPTELYLTNDMLKTLYEEFYKIQL